MKKIPTIFQKNPENLGRVMNTPPMEGIHHFKIKIDGTACMIKDGKPYCRYDAKLFRKKKGKIITYTIDEVKSKLPNGAIPCQEPDEKSGHWPHWVPVEEDNPSQKYILEGFLNLKEKVDGTYECIGPKLQGNPHNEDKHHWIPHFSEKLIFDVDNVSFSYFENLFKDFSFEGFVAYNEKQEPIGKIRRNDFGYEKITYTKISSLFE